MKNNDHHRSDEDGRLDDLFREGLKDFRAEPSRHIWKGVNRKLLIRELLRFNFTNLSRSLWIGGAAVIIISGTILIFILPGKKESTAVSIPVKEQPVIQKSPQPGTITGLPGLGTKVNPSATPEINPGRTQKNDQQLTESDPGHHKVLPKTGQPGIKGSQTPPALAGTRPKTGMPLIKEPSEKITNAETKNVRPLTESQTKPVSYEQKDTYAQSTITNSSAPARASFSASDQNEILIFRTTNPSLTLVDQPGPTVILPVEPNPYPEEIITRAPLPSFYSVALGIMPEVSFYKTASSYTKFDYWVGLDFAYHLGRFYFKPGVSYGLVNDNGNYIVSYKRLDSIGFYYHVTSYSIDPHDPAKIIYHYITSAIMDSVNHVGDEKASNRYQYFQVPMLLGFNLVETPRIRDRKSTRLNSSHSDRSRMPSSA